MMILKYLSLSVDISVNNGELMNWYFNSGNNSLAFVTETGNIWTMLTCCWVSNCEYCVVLHTGHDIIPQVYWLSSNLAKLTLYITYSAMFILSAKYTFKLFDNFILGINVLSLLKVVEFYCWWLILLNFCK